MEHKFWLLKAEPDSRVVKGKDVKFSVDDFESTKMSPWEGVRSYEARNIMKEMKVGQGALFYHSNCKTPGIAAFAKVTKEAYPDYTAWDESHPYFDPKSNPDEPKWFMVDLTFSSRAQNFIPLALLRLIADRPNSDLPEEISYIGEKGASAIKSMDLIRKGRLSVQRVSREAWDTIAQMAETGGWTDLDLKPKKKPFKVKSVQDDVGDDESTLGPPKSKPPRQRNTSKQASSGSTAKGTSKAKQSTSEESQDEEEPVRSGIKGKPATKRKRIETDIDDQEETGSTLRRSTRKRR
ncbi:PUA-like domain-containing protein [Crepidotus variabilis]|uniref:PUA-like domain-containing protein n=1 Tax=Crepidotus variabilis TaxID=179855 RepID=A0A9P6EFJ6_9AGAR|nr:PUA-like domain-containing protein [Crepidotus variabilis]